MCLCKGIFSLAHSNMIWKKCRLEHLDIIIRPGVAGAVLQTPLSFADPFPPTFQNIITQKPLELGTPCVSCDTCHVLHVTCQVSGVQCHMSDVTCHL